MGHVVSLGGVDGHVLSEAAVGLAAEQSHRRRIASVVAVKGRVNQDARADPVDVHAGTDLGDHPGDVTALNSWKPDVPRQPASACGFPGKP